MFKAARFCKKQTKKHFIFLGYVNIKDDIKRNVPFYYFAKYMAMLLLNVL